MRILAGIVLYNPDSERLSQNINAICSQVDGIAIFDNGGGDRLSLSPHIKLLSQQHNVGIAHALEALAQYAFDSGYDWLLTLDQDSVSPKNLIETYRRYTGDQSVGILCPLVKDRNYGTLDHVEKETDDLDACITSGSLIRLSAWKKTGGFWEDLFIDMVDFDICWSIRKAGYRIVRVNNLVLLHEIGVNARKVRWHGKEEVVYNHPPLRCYYMIRNSIAVCRQHKRTRQGYKWAIKRWILINRFETDLAAKNKMMMKGFIDSFKLKRKE